MSWTAQRTSAVSFQRPRLSLTATGTRFTLPSMSESRIIKVQTVFSRFLSDFQAALQTMSSFTHSLCISTAPVADMQGQPTINQVTSICEWISSHQFDFFIAVVVVAVAAPPPAYAPVAPVYPSQPPPPVIPAYAPPPPMAPSYVPPPQAVAPGCEPLIPG